jgi:hypothetical protein
MVTTNAGNRGNDAWQQLAVAHERNGCRGKQRSDASVALEVELRRLLASCTAEDVAGIWLDWVRPTREAIWLPAPCAQTDDAA